MQATLRRPMQMAVLLMVVASGVLPASLAVGQPGKPAPVAARESQGQMLTLDVTIDGRPSGRWTLLDRNGVLFAADNLLQQWGLARRVNAASVRIDGQDWYSLASVPGLEATHYFRERKLELAGGSRLARAPAAVAPVASSGPSSTPPLPPLSPTAATARTAHVQAPASIVAAPVASDPQPSSPTGPARLIPLDVAINGSREGNWVLLETGGALYAPGDALDEWRIARQADMPSITYKGQPWYKLAAVPGYEAQLNAANQSVSLKFLPGAFGATRVTQAPVDRIQVTPAVPSLFANYDLSQTFSDTRGLSTSRDLGALVELGASNDWGVLTTSHVGRNLTRFDNGFSSDSSWRRLETTFTHDFPNQNLTLRLGDTTTRTGAWGRANYFGGIQLARNFGLTPGFITQPIPTITGQSSAPSTVELYINDALRQTSKVPTGPFAIDNFPLLTGSGQARVVVRDVLGRETVLVQDFFTHSDLLDQGLSDWSLDAGAVRRNLGNRNADYGPRFGSGLYRYGVNKSVTVEGRVEAGKGMHGGGAGITLALPGQMLGQFAVAGSDDRDAGRGQQWLVGLEHTSLRHGFTFRAEGATRNYRQFGQEAFGIGYRSQMSASYTYSSESLGYVGLGYARIDSFDQGPLNTYSANYSIRVLQRGTVSFSYTKVKGNINADSFGVSLLIPLESQVNINATATSRDGKTDAYVTASKSLGIESGAGWRALAGTVSDVAHAEAGYYYQGSKGLLSSDVSFSRDQKTVRLGMQGGLVFIDRGLYLTRRVEDSFALVEVPGYANVGVGFQSSVLARTDADGRALIPRLQAYRRNSIRLDPSELPISAEIDNIEQVVVPGSRSGVKVAFPVRDGRAALVKIVLDDGEPAPAGIELKLAGDNHEFFVARRGEAFITGLKAINTLRMSLNGKTCDMTLQLPEGKTDEIARIGPVTCKGVTR
ncbi:MAG: fimbria/pilus outer membrane usher protein [Betaproteobacteria bacterium]